MNQQVQRWFFLIFLSIVWGSSFLMIKKALIGFSPMQLVAIRILLTGLFLLVIGFNPLKTITTKTDWFWVMVSGYVCTLMPIVLFAFAQTKVNSSTASILNALIPLITLLIGYIGFKEKLKRNHITGVFLGLIATWGLIDGAFRFNTGADNTYSLLIVLACCCNALNINIVKHKLNHVNPLALATGCFLVISIPAVIYMFNNGMMETSFYETKEVRTSLKYLFLLVVFSTAISRIVFNKLIQISSPTFSSTSTYLIPVVAILLGVLDGEEITWIEYIAVSIIFFSIYIINDFRIKSLIFDIGKVYMNVKTSFLKQK